MLWTVVPVLILVFIAIPSFKLMYYMDRVPNPDMTIKVTGHQWYWSYEYPDQSGLSFDSNLIPDADLKPGQKRLLDVDNPLVVPVGAVIRVYVTGTDVIHSWFVPSFGVQEYAVIGRLNETWMKVEREGVYYGRVQPDLRHQPRLHADQDPGAVERRFPALAGSRRSRNSPITATGATRCASLLRLPRTPRPAPAGN